MVNKLTDEAGLVFNVNSVKANMKAFYDSQECERPKFKGGQIAVAAALQKLCEVLIRTANKYTKKDKSGVRRVDRATLRVAMFEHEGLFEYFCNRMRVFRKNAMYIDQLPVSKNDIETVRESVDNELFFTPKALNFLNFCMVEAYQDIVSTAQQFMSYAGKKQMDGNTLVFTVRNRFHDSVALELCNEIARAMKACDQEVKAFHDDDDEEAHEDAAPEEDSDVAEEEETAAPKKSSKKGGKKVAAKKIESESSDEDEEIDDDEEEEEVVAKPKKGAKGKTTKGAKSEGKAKGGKTRRAAK